MSQGDLFAAIDAGQRGMTQAAANAELVEPGWQERALEELRRFARVHPPGAYFTIDRARESIVIESPTDGRAWGAVTQKAIRRGYIVKTGDFAPAASSHGSPKPLYVVGNGGL